MLSRSHSHKVDTPNEHTCDEEAMYDYPKTVPVGMLATADDLCVPAENVSSASGKEELRRYCDGAEQ
jgi:hypothetical protein